MPFILFQIDLSFPGFLLGVGFGTAAFGEGDGDGEGVGVAMGLGDTAAMGVAGTTPLAVAFPRHQRAASTPEPRIAISRIIATAARRNRLLP